MTTSSKVKSEAPAAPTDEVPLGKPSCFIIMPIADQNGYKPGHFKEVFEDLIGPAVENAGYTSIRADQVHASNLIHLDILGKLLDAPLAVCDLSSVNPNVMFELGIRQAFDKPCVLLRDNKTRDVFDIAPIRYVSYDAELSFRGINASKEALTRAIRDTMAVKPGEGVNSIVSLLGLRAAAIQPTEQDPQAARLSLVEKAIEDIASDIRRVRAIAEYDSFPNSSSADSEALSQHSVMVKLGSGRTVKVDTGLYRKYLRRARELVILPKDDAEVMISSMGKTEGEIVSTIMYDLRNRQKSESS